MAVIEVDHLTKDYGHQRGVFDASFRVEPGEVYGFLGPNGAGKTTTIRHIMGFSKPQSGHTSVFGKDSWTHASDIQRKLGYLPGEIALPESLTGRQFIKMMADLRGIEDMSHTDHLIKKFELDPTGKLKRMSLGMKRKLAVVTAFMHDPEVLVLDEPTSGLDPIMQQVFIDFINEQKAKGKTVLLSSHLFNEVDATCDNISIIKDGQLVSSFHADDLRHNDEKVFEVELLETADFERFERDIQNVNTLEVMKLDARRRQAKVFVRDADMNDFVTFIGGFRIKFFSQIKFTLEDYFMDFYNRKPAAEVS